MTMQIRLAVIVQLHIAVAVLSGACTSPTPGQPCGDQRCSVGETCRVTETPSSVRAMCVRDDDPNLGGQRCGSNCPVAVCGDGMVSTGEACDDGNAADFDGCKRDCTPSLRAYIKASNTHPYDTFGSNVALSADGSTLAVGAPSEGGGATGVGGDQANQSVRTSGAVYVFVRSGTTWIQQAYVKASNPDSDDQFGTTVALSADGSTMAITALGESSAAAGVDGDQADNAAQLSGAVYVFARGITTWAQQAYVKASNPGANDQFGYSLALSADGSTLAVGAAQESSAATGIDGDQTDDSAPLAGAVYVFTRNDATWTQQAYIKGAHTELLDEFGASVALTADGSMLAVGARFESSAASGIDGDQTDNSALLAGAAYIFTRSGTTWIQQTYIKASNPELADGFGVAVALSADGSTLAVGAFGEDSAATGVGGDQTDNSAHEAGAAYVFTRSDATWTQQAYLKASNPGELDKFGFAVALSADGSTLAVTAWQESSAATGVDGDQTNDSAPGAGAVYVFTRSNATWSQQAYVKASNTNRGDNFGSSLAISGDASTLAAGGPFEDSAAIGIDSDPADTSAPLAGAAYVFY